MRIRRVKLVSYFFAYLLKGLPDRYKLIGNTEIRRSEYADISDETVNP